MYELRSYRAVADVWHWCDNCRGDIFPGSEYEAVVYVTKSRRLIVYKRHINPSCEWPEDPVDEEHVLVLRYAVRMLRRAA